MRLLRRTAAGLALITTLILPACTGGSDEDSTATATTDPASGSTPTATATSTVEPAPDPSSTPAPSPTEAEPGVKYELSATMGGPVVPQFPYDVALLGDGRIAVADLGLNEVQIYSRDGSLDRSWAATERSPEEEAGWYLASRIAAANDSLYVSFAGTSKLSRFDLEGNVLAEHIFEDPNSRLRDLTAGPDGRLYLVVGDRQRQSGVLVFDPDLNLAETWDTPRGAAPLALAFDSEGVANVLLSDDSARLDGEPAWTQPTRIARIDPSDYSPDAWETPLELPVEGQFDGLAFAPNGSYVHVVPAGGGDATRWELPEQGAIGFPLAPGVAFVDDGTMLIADPLNNRLLEVSLDGEILDSIEDQRQARFASPDAIAIGPDGNVFVVDAVLGVVHEFTPGGDLVRSRPITARQVNPFVNLIDIAVDSNGDIYIAGPTPPQIGSFRKLDSEGRETVIEVDIVQDLESRFMFHPDSAAIGSDGLIYLGMGQIAQVRGYTDEGETAVRWPEDPEDIDRVYQVAAGSDGVFALLERQIDGQPAMVIERLDDSEKIVAIFQGARADTPPLPDSIDARPWDFAVVDDSFFVLDLLTQDVLQLSPDGQAIGRLETGNDSNREFLSIAVDDDRRVYLADTTNREILVYSPVE